MTLQVGQMLSHYRLAEKLGEGGMGVVYKALDTRLKRPVAIKILPPEVTADAQRRRRLLREARTAAAVTHPNVAAIHEADEAGGMVFIAMEYVEGRTLRSLIGPGPLPVAEALRLGADIAEGLASAHQARVIHRDLKPDNVMVRPDGHVKILDFGLAKLVEERGERTLAEASRAETLAADLTREGVIAGTPVYMSPEQARGQPVDARSDLFSFGSVLYEMVTGRRPFQGATLTDTLRAILSAAPVPAAVLNPQVPPELERILSKCLEKAPRDRYQHADDLLVDLRRLRQGSEAPAPRVAPGTRAWAPRWAITMGGIGLALVALWLIVQSMRPRPQDPGGPGSIKSLAVLPFETASGDPDAEYFSDGVTETLINTLSQLPQLRVMARNTVFHYKGQQADPRKVGRDLAVSAVLTGRVVRRGNALVVRAELVDTARGWHLWGEQYDRKMSDIFQVEAEIARKISDGLELNLTSEQETRLSKRHTENTEAYRLYLRGRYHANRYQAGDRQALEYFTKAIEVDPGYALAYAGVAEAYWLMSNFTTPPQEAMPKARAAANKALELDPNLAEAHAMSAMIADAYDWDWDASERGFRRALELNPGSALTRLWYGMYLVQQGRPEAALVELNLARKLDPLSPTIGLTAVWPYYYAPPRARQYDRVIKEVQKIIETEPDFHNAHGLLGFVYAKTGQFERAIDEWQEVIRLGHSPTFSLGSLGLTYALAGERTKAEKVLEDLMQMKEHGDYVSSTVIARLYAGLGERDKSFEWLDKAYISKDEELTIVKVDPDLDGLRSDPRFADLLRRMKLAP